MMSTYVPAKDVRHILNATFPNYRKKQVAIRPTGGVTFTDLNWSGGTRSEYRSCTLTGQSIASMSNYNAMAPWDPRQAEGKTIEIPPGFCIVEAGTFCGKPSMAYLYIHPDDMPRLLPTPKL